MAIIYLTLSSIVFMISSYLMNIFLGRFLGPEAYGKYGIIITIISIIGLIQTNSLPLTVSKLISENHQSFRTSLNLGLKYQTYMSLIFMTILYFISPLIGTILKDSSLVDLLRFSIIIIPINGFFTVFTGFYNGLRSYKNQAFLGIVYSLAKSILGITLTYFLFLEGILTAFIIAPLLSVLLFARDIDYKSLVPTKRDLTDFPYFTYTINLTLFALFSNIFLFIDIFFIQFLSTQKEMVGYYTANQNIARIPFFALNAFSAVLFPSITKNVSLKLHQNSRVVIHRALRSLLLVLAPIVLLISLSSAELLRYLYSDVYLAGAASLSVLVYGMGFLTLFILFANIINGRGKPIISLYIAVIGVLLTGLLCWILIPRYELVGAAFATTIGVFASMSLAAGIVYRQFTALISIIKLLRIGLACFVMFLVNLLISLPTILLPIQYITLFATYIFTLFLLGELNHSDYMQAKNTTMSYYRKIIRKG
jgi:stage V sporulation protein B